MGSVNTILKITVLLLSQVYLYSAFCNVKWFQALCEKENPNEEKLCKDNKQRAP